MRFVVSSSCLFALIFLFTCGTAPRESASSTPATSIAPSTAKPKDKDEWRVYTPPDKSFSVELPCEPMRTNVSADATPTYQYACGVEEFSRLYMIYVMELSDTWKAKLRDAAELERSIRESFAPNKRVVKMTPFTVEGGIGREIIVHNLKNPEELSRGRVIVIGARHYQIAFGSDDEKALHGPDAERFFASFKPK
jgi:hypothetical protein